MDLISPHHQKIEQNYFSKLEQNECPLTFSKHSLETFMEIRRNCIIFKKKVCSSFEDEIKLKYLNKKRNTTSICQRL